MLKKQMESLRKILIDQKQNLLEKVKTSSTTTKDENPNEVKDSADAASDYYERELAWGLSETERLRLQEVEDALERIDHGGYGKCESCGGMISPSRLEVLPFAKLCIECQAKEEQNQKKASLT